MAKMCWQTPEQLRFLLNELVGWKSVTLTEGEIQFPYKLYKKIQSLPYFQNHPEHVSLHDADFNRTFLTALYKHPKARKTVCLISHFDTVNTTEYGEFEHLATNLEELTKIWLQSVEKLPEEIREDILSGNYLFGRGTMDMKMGLVLHLQLLEKASTYHWPINLLLLTVPDEEVNSSGMRHAVSTLVQLQQKYRLEYRLFLNSEPVFSMNGNQQDYIIYTGTIGKILTGALFYGKEAHAGEPLRGLTSSYIASFLTRKMEWNERFQEVVFSERTPLPVTLQQKDLNLEYSAQTPYRSSALYNIFLMKRTPLQVLELLEEAAREAAEELNQEYKEICKKHGFVPAGTVQVIRYQELLAYATKKLGLGTIEKIKAKVLSHDEWDDRDKSIRLAEQIMIYCQELAPAIIILFAPPYYPAVNSSSHPFIQKCVKRVMEVAQERFQLPIKQVHFFNGICDLSYVNGEDSRDGWAAYKENTPVWPDSYHIPFNEMAALKAPVLNIGPFGKDPHKRTERLNMKSAFEETPVLLEEVIRLTWEETKY